MENLDLSKLPKHIAIIMDGNGRWAQEQGQDRLFGHYQGVISVRKVVEAATEIGIQYLTLYAFSTENWERPEQEVTGLMTLFVDTIAKEVPDLHKNNIKLRFIGNLGLLPPHARAALENATTQTAQNTGLTLIVALSYSSRWELVEAAKNIATKVKKGNLNIDQISETTLSEALTTSDFPDPELMIRTSGEYRISNFLLYQLAYAELYFTETRWPDFRKEDLIKAILDFQSRERRFGKTSSQLNIDSEK
ncbi:MAG: isoprenyl transferase [Chitinophagia bacterium]|jgi:undecaprenyl diphosphate synthase|nr:isoprenyl transferase [Chitinophagia bacterium]NDD15475.1 isoprenyl transferase [Chitinophagia bacterium]